MKTTLVAVSGMSPAIITETLWALAGETPAIVPDEVVIITTARGDEDIQSLLLKNLPAWGGRCVWETLRSALLKRAKLPPRHSGLQLSIHVIDLPNEATGIREKARDIRSANDNQQTADFILGILSPHTDAADRRVIASIAGGRKTMGALLYGAMSLVGKESDRVTHVLVNEPFENCRGFFYPDQPVQKLEAGPYGKTVTVTAAAAVIELADIPFVPLRNGFAELNESRRSFAGLVTRYSRELQRPLGRKPVVSLDANKAQLVVEGIPIPLTGRELLATSFLFLRAKEGKPSYSSQQAAGDPYLQFVGEWKMKFPKHRARERLKQDAVPQDLTKGLCTLRKKLETKGLAHTVAYLAPERSRVGFEIEIA